MVEHHKCGGCSHCIIEKRLKEMIKSFKPVPGPYSVRYKVVGLLSDRKWLSRSEVEKSHE